MKTFAAVTLAAALLCSCASYSRSGKNPASSPSDVPVAAMGLDAAQRLQKESRFTDALASYRKIIQAYPGTEWASTAQYRIALIYVNAENPHRDYAQALVEFDEFLAKFPSHELASEARSWRHAIKMILDTKKENERLNRSIEKLQQLDVQQEERRRK
ncbi:MAG: tetratricopeptide repeat protein [Nitrospiraceae bacterium]|nr:tetratricopeptide repeat protein [Nitrospiraceae bacterium]